MDTTEKFTYKLIDYIYDNFIQNEQGNNLEWEQETFDFVDDNLVIPEYELQIQQNQIDKLKEENQRLEESYDFLKKSADNYEKVLLDEIRVLRERLAGLS